MLFRDVRKILEQIRCFRQLHLADILQFRFGRQNAFFNALLLTKQIPNCVIRRSICAPFRQRRAVIVAGDGWLIRLAVVVICTRSEPEVRAAVEHIQIKARIHIQKRMDFLLNFIRSARMVLIPPMVEPTAPKFAAHIGHIFLIVI